MCHYVSFFFKGYTPAQLGNYPLAHQRSGSDGRWILSILMTLQLQHILVMSITHYKLYTTKVCCNYMVKGYREILYLQYTEII